MCRPASMIATKDKIFWSKTNESHTDIIEEFGLREQDVRGEFLIVPIEIKPPEGDMLRPLDEWVYSIDMGSFKRDCIPSWYDEEKVERRARTELEEWFKQKVIPPGKSRTVKYANAYCYGAVKAEMGSVVEVRGEGEAVACDNSVIDVYEKGSVLGRDHCLIASYNNTFVNAYDDAYVCAFDDSTVSSFGNNLIDAYDHSMIEAFNNSIVRAHHYSLVKTHDNAIVRAEYGSKVIAHDDSVVMAHFDSQVTGHDRSIIIGYADIPNKKILSKEALLVDRS